jgi:hypothetical protein
MTKTKLHQMGYRLGKTRDLYWKRRRVKSRPESKATVQVKLREHGWYDVTSTEAGQTDDSIMLKGVRQLRQWESFAFCS